MACKASTAKNEGPTRLLGLRTRVFQDSHQRSDSNEEAPGTHCMVLRTDPLRSALVYAHLHISCLDLYI